MSAETEPEVEKEQKQEEEQQNQANESPVGRQAYLDMTGYCFEGINRFVAQHAGDEEAQKKALMGCMRGLLKTVADIVKAEGQLVNVASLDNKAYISVEPLTKEEFEQVKEQGMFVGFGNARNIIDIGPKLIKKTH